jgi:hypothetical protein
MKNCLACQLNIGHNLTTARHQIVVSEVNASDDDFILKIYYWVFQWETPPAGRILNNGDLESLLLLKSRRRLYMKLCIISIPFLMKVLTMHMWRVFRLGGISK